MSQSRSLFSALISLSVDCHTARSPTPDTLVTGMGIFPAAQVSTVVRPRPGRSEIVSVVRSAVLNTQDCGSPGRAFSDATGSPRISAASANVTSFRSHALPTGVLAAAFAAPCDAAAPGSAPAMKNDANLYAFGRLTDEICNQFRTAAYVLAIYGKIDGGATTVAMTHYTDARNLRCILRSTWGAVCNEPFQKDSFVGRERPVLGSTVVIGFYHQAMVVGFFLNCCKIPIALIKPKAL